MKDFLKNNQQNIILIIVVAIVSSVMFYFALGFKTKTEELKTEKNTLEGQTSAINSTKFLLDATNSGIADENISIVKGGFNEHYRGLIEQYNYRDDGVTTMSVEDAKEKFDDAIRGFTVRLNGANVAVADEYEYSFGGENRNIIQMGMDKKALIFEQLTAIEAIVNIVSGAKVKSLVSVTRTSDLSKVKTSETFADIYTFSIEVTAAPEATQALINQLSNDPHFYFRLNNINITSPAQVDGKLKSLVSPNVVVQVDETKAVASDVDALLSAAEESGLGDTVVVEVSPNHSTNYVAFNPTVQTVKIDFDWVQFKESYLIKE